MSSSSQPAHPAPGRLTFGPVQVDLRQHKVRLLDGQVLKLTGIEFAFLECLALAAGRIVPQQEMELAVYGRLLSAESTSLRAMLHDLRRKLPLDADGVGLIQTIRSRGFRIRLPDEQCAAGDAG